MVVCRCQCGMVSFGSMYPPRCTACPKCGTVPSPIGFMSSQPHEFQVGEVEAAEGTKQESRCQRCGKTWREVEREYRK